MDFIKNANFELNKLLKSDKFKKIFIISGKNSYFKSGASNLFKNSFKDKTTFFYFKKNFIPEIAELKTIILKLHKFKPDLIIAIGGGSVLDYAKSASVLNISNNLKNRIISSNLKIKNKLYKLIAIPTTGGSGAEVTASSVIYINKRKYSIENELLKPDFFFIIPKLIINLSKPIKASTGFDAISQSMESLISTRSNAKSVKYAQKSLELSLKHYIDYLNNPNLENSFYMALAANFSGKAINISKTTAPHAISYPFTSFYKIPHGHAVSLTLNEFFKFNFFNKEKSRSNFNLNNRFKIIFKNFKVNTINELDIFLNNLKKEAKLENNFKTLGIDIKSNYSKLIDGVNLKRLKNNPINIEKSDIKKILLDKI